MAWFKIDDQFPDHRKVASLSDAAFRVHVAGIAYCARGLTDGVVQAEDVPRLVRRYRKTALQELVECGLWVPTLGNYMIHDYLDWNDSRERVHKKQASAADRRARYDAMHASQNASGNASTNASVHALQDAR